MIARDARHRARLRRRLPAAPRRVRMRRGARARRARRGGCASAVSTAVTDSTPGSASTACSAALRSGSSRGPRSRLDLDREADIAVAD